MLLVYGIHAPSLTGRHSELRSESPYWLLSLPFVCHSRRESAFAVVRAFPSLHRILPVLIPNPIRALAEVRRILHHQQQRTHRSPTLPVNHPTPTARIAKVLHQVEVWRRARNLP